MMQTFSEMKNMEGEHVNVFLDDSSSPDAKMTGLLIHLSEEGEVKMRTTEGVRYGWPCLRVERATEAN